MPFSLRWRALCTELSVAPRRQETISPSLSIRVSASSIQTADKTILSADTVLLYTITLYLHLSTCRNDRVGEAAVPQYRSTGTTVLYLQSILNRESGFAVHFFFSESKVDSKTPKPSHPAHHEGLPAKPPFVIVCSSLRHISSI